MVKTKEELEEDLCEYCPLSENLKGVYNTPGGYSAECEGSHCNETYEIYLEENESNKNKS